MNRENFEFLIASLVFEMLPKETQEFFHSIMSMPAKSMSAEAVTTEGAVLEVAITAKGASSEVAPVEVPAKVPKSPTTPWPRPTPTQEGPKPKKDK